ncbi:hypothetical protein ACLOJK_022823 [Asimina triloba]
MIFSAPPEHRIRRQPWLPAMGFPVTPPSANRSRPSRRPHADPSIQPIRISSLFYNAGQPSTHQQRHYVQLQQIRLRPFFSDPDEAAPIVASSSPSSAVRRRPELRPRLKQRPNPMPSDAVQQAHHLLSFSPFDPTSPSRLALPVFAHSSRRSTHLHHASDSISSRHPDGLKPISSAARSKSHSTPATISTASSARCGSDQFLLKLHRAVHSAEVTSRFARSTAVRLHPQQATIQPFVPSSIHYAQTATNPTMASKRRLLPSTLPPELPNPHQSGLARSQQLERKIRVVRENNQPTDECETDEVKIHFLLIRFFPS